MFVTLMVGGPRSPSAPPRGPPSMFLSIDGGHSRISVRGPAIDVFFNLSSGHYQTHWQRPPGACHRCPLQPQWWLLLDPLVASSRGATIDIIFNLSGGHCWTRRQRPLEGPPSISSSTSVVATARPTSSAPQEAHHRHHLRPQWWLLSDLSVALPMGPTIDVFFNLGGGHCQTRLQHP
jgi:hypothetical protein